MFPTFRKRYNRINISRLGLDSFNYIKDSFNYFFYGGNCVECRKIK